MIYRTRIEVRHRARSSGACVVCGGRMTKSNANGQALEFRLANATTSKWIPVHGGCLYAAPEDQPRPGEFSAGLLGGLLGNVLGQVLAGGFRRPGAGVGSSFRDRRSEGVSLRRTSPTSHPRLSSPNAPIDAEFEEKEK